MSEAIEGAAEVPLLQARREPEPAVPAGVSDWWPRETSRRTWMVC
jgi:hypothetical protein